VRAGRTAEHAKSRKPKKNRFIQFGWHKRTPGWGGRMVWLFDMFALNLLIIPAFVLLVAYHFFAQNLPPLTAFRQAYLPPTISRVYADHGELIGEFAREYRMVVPYEKIPDHVIKAFVAAEDANYFQHPGVDFTGMARAFIENIKAQRIVQGGSTITQQVTRTFVLSNERTYERKIREALLAWRLEKNLSKKEILYLYLNQIYLGEGAYGVAGAAKMYFDKDLNELSVAEAAMMAGLVQAPSRLSPFTNPDDARGRQIYVINQMRKNNFITPEKAEQALNEKQVLKKPDNPNLRVPGYTEHVRREIEQNFGSDRLYDEGMKVYTTVNLEMQQMARQAVDKGLTELARRQGYSGPIRHLNPDEYAAFLEKQKADKLEIGAEYQALVDDIDLKKTQLYIKVGTFSGLISKKNMSWAVGRKRLNNIFAKGDVIPVAALSKDEKSGQYEFELKPHTQAQAALICLDNKTGQIKAMVGGRDFEESQFNRAVQALRQPGSAFKPFVYTAAMDTGFTPADVVWDEPVFYEDHGQEWTPQNYDRAYDGPVTLYNALVRSRNVVAVRLLEKVGPETAVKYAHMMGINSDLRPYLSLALGASEVTLLDMVTAYSVFPNLGERLTPRFITHVEDRYGKIIARTEHEAKKVLDPQTAYVVLHMLQGVVQRGTGTRVAALKRPVAGKTGTTNDLADAWFVGFTPEYTVGVWVGYDVRKRLGRRESGGRAAAPIFLYFMQAALKDRPVNDFTAPPGVECYLVDPVTGWFADGETPEQVNVCFKQGYVGQSAYSEIVPDPSLGMPSEGYMRYVYKDGQLYEIRDDNSMLSPDDLFTSPRVLEADDRLYPDPTQPALPGQIAEEPIPATSE
jgi:penicillin-binding protein 1A